MTAQRKNAYFDKEGYVNRRKRLVLSLGSVLDNVNAHVDIPPAEGQP